MRKAEDLSLFLLAILWLYCYPSRVYSLHQSNNITRICGIRSSTKSITTATAKTNIINDTDAPHRRRQFATTYDEIMKSTTRRGLPSIEPRYRKLLQKMATAVDHWLEKQQKCWKIPLPVPKIATILFHTKKKTKQLPGSDKAKHLKASIQQFRKVFAIRPGEKVLLLTDPLLDPRVIDAVRSLANERGAASVTVYEGESTRYVAIPEHLRPLVANATFVVSTWFASVFDPFCQKLRRQEGQRWIKITLFRNLDLWQTPMASYPLEIVSELVQATQRLYPDHDEPFMLRITDPRGTDLRIPFSAAMRQRMRTDNRWRGHNVADEDGCYVHYLPVHGPNLYDPFMFGNDPNYQVGISGIIRPQWSVGLDYPFAEDDVPEIEFQNDRVVAVRGGNTTITKKIFQDFLLNGTLEELGCGHNPKAPRFDIYPAGPNSVGSLHFGINGLVESEYFKRAMPDWEEPHVHADLVCYDCTVTAGNNVIVDGGYLMSLEDTKVIAVASKYGDPDEVLSLFPVK